ncbi:MAG: copper resistance protein NlpE N-terminal domain-containing protein [Bacteroidia bacterium]
MKLKKSAPIAAIATAAIVFNFSSCTYEDGPTISLKSKTGRLVGEWEITQFAGENVPSGVEYEMEFEKNGDFAFHITYDYYGYSYSYDSEGEWEWGSGKESVELDLDGDTYEFQIKRLTNKELWMEDEEGDEWEMEKK